MMTDITFLTDPADQPTPWRVVHAGLEYPGEVVAARRWDPQWGERLQGDRFFRIILLTEPQGDVTVEDQRIAACVPRISGAGARDDIDRGLRSISEARSLYRAGRQPDTGQLQSFLAGQEASLRERLLREMAGAYASGSIITTPELTLDPTRLFDGPTPSNWFVAVGELLLRHAYPSPPVDRTHFPEPLTSRHVEQLLEALFSPEPGPEARHALDGFGPGLRLAPSLWSASPLLEPIGRSLELAGAAIPAHQLLERVARNLPAVELTITPDHGLRTRSGTPFSGSRVTWDLMPELAWDDDLLSSLETLRLQQPPTWPAILPYLEPLYPGVTSAGDPAGHQERFLQALATLRTQVQGLHSDLRALTACLGQQLSPETSEVLDLLTSVAAPSDPFHYYLACVRASASPSILSQALHTRDQLSTLGSAQQEILEAKVFLETAVAGQEQQELSAEAAMLEAQIDLPALAANPALWPARHAQITRLRLRYAAEYRAFHTAYYQSAQELRRQLEFVWPRMEALERFNLLDELGPPTAPELLSAFRRLFTRLLPCSVPPEELGLEERPVCRWCGLRLMDRVPQEETAAALQTLEEALVQQNRRLSTFAIHQILEQPDTALMDKFLRLARASDLDALADVLDDQVLAFLRTLLRQP